MCVGKYCAGETMLDRLMSMANAHVQAGRYYKHLSNCETGGKSVDTIKFTRAFTEAPTVLTTIYQYDSCFFGGYDRATTWVDSATATGFTATASTWSDTRLYALGIEVCTTGCLGGLRALSALAAFDVRETAPGHKDL